MQTGHNLECGKAGRLVLLVVLALGAMALAGCRQGRFTPDAKFVDLYVELKLATVVFANDHEKGNETRRVILAQHGFTPSEFHDRYVALMEHPEAWRDFQERVIAKVDEFQSSRKGDTANGI
jgi:hypothetical protein